MPTPLFSPNPRSGVQVAVESVKASAHERVFGSETARIVRVLCKLQVSHSAGRCQLVEFLGEIGVAGYQRSGTTGLYTDMTSVLPAESCHVQGSPSARTRRCGRDNQPIVPPHQPGDSTLRRQSLLIHLHPRRDASSSIIRRSLTRWRCTWGSSCCAAVEKSTQTMSLTCE